MSSPAERYAAARRRAAQAAQFPALDEFALDLGFDLDDFQREACQALERGSGVLVCAPTGAGKTVVGEFAVHLALRGAPGRPAGDGGAATARRKCFYTTPIKALSNQKYHDLVDRHGADQVGLLTGDNAINGDAPVVVMTTEVLRNMLYAGSATLEGLAYVVMDEVHYLADRFRGGVWEEVIIHLPASVTLVSLSATVSNAEEFADWLVTVRGETAVVVSEHRPVPLWQHMLVGRRMFDLFHDADAARKHDVHPELLRYTRDTMRRLELGEGRSAFPGGGRRGPRWRGPLRPDIVDRLDREGLLPAILFIFSRAGCDAAVQQCLAAGLRLTSPEERAEIRRVVESRITAIPGEDLSVLGYWEWLDGLERGLAAHHAGMLPAFKEVVEELFVRGLVKAVFATETLALGINMPARCVVLERLVKFNGEAHVDLTPGEYTQLTGRAGRRGIDVEGTPSSCGRPRRTPGTWPGWPPPAPTRCAPASGRRTTWPSTSSAASGPSRPVPCWSPRSPSSRRTGRWSAWPGRCNATPRPSMRTARRRPATTATSTSTSRCGWPSPTGSGRWPGRASTSARRRRWRRWSGCVSAT
ncbi:ATP-dependent RNA helicase HelY [Micromonospora olivasterospora]|uniref:ATP-dependent RNA helicase HelY n=1 Tax=Micromonospora olivasterospora TaxID=1880 RepID=A0A562IGN0_MICOL|nr:ATP-dependent RNA helicase HelY [Micromonospora olivasterospora]